MIGEVPSGPNVKYLTIAWDTATNEIDFDASIDGLSCFDACGVLSIALELAAQRVPVPQTDEESDPELEDE
jgi:hypothetical protein